MCFNASVYMCVLFLDEPIDVVLCSVLVVGHLEHTRHTQQRFLSVSVAHHLEKHTHGNEEHTRGRG